MAKLLMEKRNSKAITPVQLLGFSTSNNEQVNARVASSFISEEQAELNLKELGKSDFDEIAEKGKDRWNEVLGKIKVEDENIDNLRTFYSNLYRTVLFPRNLSELMPTEM